MKNGKAFALLSALILGGCGDNGTASNPLLSVLTDKMEGCYATEKGKPADIKIENESGKYYASFLQKGGWKKEPKPLAAAPKNDIKKLFKEDADKVDVALVYPEGAFGLFKFKEGVSVNGKDPESDFMALIFIGAGPVFQSDCQ